MLSCLASHEKLVLLNLALILLEGQSPPCPGLQFHLVFDDLQMCFSSLDLSCELQAPTAHSTSHLSSPQPLPAPHCMCNPFFQSAICIHVHKARNKMSLSLSTFHVPMSLTQSTFFSSTSPSTSRTTNSNQLPETLSWLVAVGTSQLAFSHSSLSQVSSASHRSMLSSLPSKLFLLSQEEKSGKYSFKERGEGLLWSGPGSSIDFTLSTLLSLSAFQPSCPKMC